MKSLRTAIIPFVTVFTICAGFYLYNNIVWQDPEWNSWKEFNSVRSDCSDYPLPEYEDAATKLTNYGLSENDYYLPQNWITADPDVYSTEAIAHIASLKSNLTFRDKVENLLNYFHGVAKSLPFHIALIGIIFIVFSSILYRTKVLAQLAITFFLVAIICLYFAATGRLPERVEVPIWLLAFASVSLSTRLKVSQISNLNETNNTSKERTQIIGNSLGATTWIIATLLILSVTVPRFSFSLLPAYLNQDSFEPNHPAIDYITSHNENIYVWGTLSYASIERSYMLKFLPPQEFLEHNFSLGGWTDRAPFAMAARENVGMANVIKGLADNKGAYLIIRDKSEKNIPNMLIIFIQEHYYPNATIKKVDSFLGSNDPENTFSVWKINK